jgi:FkbM family methyltransferase
LGALALARRFLTFSPDEKRYFLRRFVDLKVHARPGFSQFGEDASVAAFLRVIGRSCQNYLDLGANDPVVHNNTYLFYRDGARGTLFEANPVIAKRLRRKRPRDLIVNMGVIPEGSGMLDLHIMDMDGLSTLSDTWRETIASEQMAKTLNVVSVPVLGINDLLLRHAPKGPIDFTSLDIEGMDFDVLSAWDFERWRPFLFCIETAVVGVNQYTKDERFSALMAERDYRPLIDTFANTIFIDER